MNKIKIGDQVHIVTILNTINFDLTYTVIAITECHYLKYTKIGLKLNNKENTFGWVFPKDIVFIPKEA